MRTVLLALLALLLAAPVADARLYWTGWASDAIGRAELDGSGVNESFILATPNGGGMSATTTHLYWAELYTHKTWRANVDGTGAAPFIHSGSDVGDVVVGDLYVYWADQSTDSIGRARLDGSQVDQSFITGATNAIGLAISDTHLYWGVRNDPNSAIGRANLDGTGVDHAFIPSTNNPVDVAVDGEHVYWAQINDGEIGRANLDGTDVRDHFIPEVSSPGAVTADGGHVLWTATGRIGKARADGTEVNRSFIVSSSQPSGLALDPFGRATTAITALDLGAGGTGTVAVKNTGKGPLTLGTPAAGGDFAASGCAGAKVAPGAVCEVTVTFTPSAAGARNATLTIPSDDGRAPLSVALTGTGPAPPPVPAPAPAPPPPPAAPAAPVLPAAPVARPVSSVKTTTGQVAGAKVALTTPRACVQRGNAFPATMKAATAGARIKQVQFQAGKQKKLDKKAPFTQKMTAPAAMKRGAQLNVLAKVTAVLKGKTQTKTIKASVKSCA